MTQARYVPYFATRTALLLIIFIDGVGISLVLPLLADLFDIASPHAIVTSAYSSKLQTVLYSVNLAIYSFAMIFGAGFLGQLSDRIGRKKALWLSLLGTLIGYLICSLAILLKLPWIFALGRGVCGIAFGSVPVAQAALLDMEKQSKQMTSIGWVMFAITSGYMFGPLLADLILRFSTNNTYSVQMLFLFVSGLCVLCLPLLSNVKETKFSDCDLKTKRSQSLTDLYKVFIGNRQLQSALGGLLFVQLGWSLFYQYTPYLLHHHFNLAAETIRYLLTTIGVGMCFTFCWLIGKVQPLASSKTLAKLNALALFILPLTLMLLPLNHGWGLSICLLLMSVSYSLGYSSSLVFILSLEDKSHQGLVLGTSASLAAASATVTAIAGSGLSMLGAIGLLGTSSLCFLVAYGFIAATASKNPAVAEQARA